MTDQNPEQDILSSTPSSNEPIGNAPTSGSGKPLGAAANGDDQQATTMPLVGGVLRPDDLPETSGADIDAAAGGSSAARGTLLVLLVFAIGVGALCLMRRNQLEDTPSKDAKQAEEKVDHALERLATSFAAAEGDSADTPSAGGQNNTEAIVAMFAADPAKQQVPLQYLKRNPFLLVAPTVEPEVKPDTKAPVGRSSASQKKDRLDQLNKRFAAMHLQTVMQGKFPMAIIDGQIVKAGSSIGPFKVEAIEKRTVILKSEGREFKLNMLQD